MMNKSDIQKILKENPDLKSKLFERGFFFTDDEVNDEAYPFYGIWKRKFIQGYTLMVSEKQNYYIDRDESCTYVLVGHAYDPIDSLSQEQDILHSLQKSGFLSEAFWLHFNNLTGIFSLIVIDEAGIYMIGDPTCMQTTFYCTHNGHIYVSSHTNCIGDFLSFEWDDYVKDLVNYKFFKLLGNSLPGDLTQFKEVKRLVPNHYVHMNNSSLMESKRFYWPETISASKEKIANQAANIMHSNLELIAKKWRKPAISMTGGCDSKTTLACANGLYEKFDYFSYISSESELVDAEAAHEICDALGLAHRIYRIPDNDADFSNIEAIRTLLFWNTGGICQSNKNDVRKRITFMDTDDFDVEVKSWASEIGRAYYSKRFNGRKNFGKTPTPRVCTTMYKFFLHNRKLVKKTDEVFKSYLDTYFEQSKANPIEWQEQFFWEFRVPSWNGLVITGEHRFSFDITIPYNNRRLLQLLLSVAIEDRINDGLYTEIRNLMNPDIDSTGVAVANLKHTKNRSKAEDLYYVVHSKVTL
jgi:hypothetical protein